MHQGLMLKIALPSCVRCEQGWKRRRRMYVMLEGEVANDGVGEWCADGGLGRRGVEV